MNIDDFFDLFGDKDNRKIFSTLADRRRVSRMELAYDMERSGIRENKVTSYLNQLLQAGLIEKAPSIIPIYDVYYVTVDGLAAERNLNNLMKKYQ